MHHQERVQGGRSDGELRGSADLSLSPDEARVIGS
jgi:hypothetical protein